MSRRQPRTAGERGWTFIAVGVGVAIASVAALAGAGAATHPRAAPVARTTPLTVDAPTTTSSTAPPATTPTTTAAPAGSWVKTSVDLTVGGLARRYLVVRPSVTTGAALPVVVVLHGRWVTPELEVTRTAFPSVTGAAILVYPAASGDDHSWNGGACCGSSHDRGIDDVAFVATVIQRVLRDQPDASAAHVY